MSDAACANCGTALIGAHCHGCGQPAHVHRTLAAIGHDLAHGVFHFEGKIAATLPLLAFRPGELTRRYSHGERAKFVSPLALFLFCVFLMFTVMSSFGASIDTDALATAGRARQDIARARATNDKRGQTLASQRAEAVAAHSSTTRIDADLAALRSDTQALDIAEGILTKSRGNSEPGRVRVYSSSPIIDQHIQRAIENPQLMIYKLQSKAYKLSWALIPLSLPLMWLLFAWRRDLKMYDHTVFVTYSIAAMTLLAIVMTILRALGLPWSWLVLAVPLHWFVQLKQAYRLTNAGAAWRTVALGFGSMLTLILFAVLMIVLGLT